MVYYCTECWAEFRADAGFLTRAAVDRTMRPRRLAVIQTDAQPRAVGPGSLPPSPRAPAWLVTLRYVRDPIPLIEACARELGDIFTLRLVGSGNWVFLTRPDHLKTMFLGAPESLHAGAANTSVFGPVTGTRAAFGLDEEPHLRRRRLLLQPLHGDRMQEYAEVVRDLTEAMVRSWPTERSFALHPHLQRTTLRVILRAIFGLDRAAENGRLWELLVQISDAPGSALFLSRALQWNLGRFSPWGRMLGLIRDLDRALLDEIRRRRVEPLDPSRSDIFSLLLRATDEDGQPLSERDLRDELVTMLLAGHETTGTGLAWAFERILSEPEIQQKVRSELEAVLAGGRLERAHLPRLRYLDAVLKETLRFRPIMPIGGSRKVVRPFEVGGFMLPPGTTVTNCMYLVMRRPELFPEPESFRPERFLERQPDPWEWTAFGGGVRRCLGMAFALLEMKVVVATVLSMTHLRLAVPKVGVARRGFFLAPEGGPPVWVDRFAPPAARAAPPDPSPS